MGSTRPPEYSTRYQIDRSDRIASVDEAWSRFAHHNRAPELAGGHICGRPLWDFVADIETRHLYELLFEAVRTGGRPVVLPFRCDSPDRRRYMELEVSALPDGELQLTASLLREESRSPVLLLDEAQRRGSETLSICSFCKRIPVESGEWAELDEAVAALGLFTRAGLPRLSHAVCPDCRALVRQRAGAPEASGTDAGGDPAGRG